MHLFHPSDLQRRLRWGRLWGQPTPLLCHRLNMTPASHHVNRQFCKENRFSMTQAASYVFSLRWVLPLAACLLRKTPYSRFCTSSLAALYLVLPLDLSPTSQYKKCATWVLKTQPFTCCLKCWCPLSRFLWENTCT